MDDRLHGRRLTDCPRLRRAGFALLCCLVLSTQPTPASSFEILYSTSPGLESLGARLAGIEPERIRSVVDLVGGSGSDEPIRVFLAAEDSLAGRSTRPWIAGYAIGEASRIVIFPARIPSYPHSSLEEVLLHELSHVLSARRAEHQPLPRWFNEGLAMAAGSPWGLGDRSRLALAFRKTPLRELSRAFEGNQTEVGRAYVLAGAIMNDILRQHGRGSAARTLDGVALGLPFDEAFRRATGESLSTTQNSFWRRYSIWYRWIPLLTSSATLWIGITVLALLAFRRRRARDAELRQHWLEEELADETPNDETTHATTVH